MSHTIISKTATPNLKIEDYKDNPNNIASSTITFETNEVISEMSLTLDISHTYIRDLVVTLKGPDGTEVNLHNKTGGSADDIKKNYTDVNTPVLKKFIGKPSNGTWTLTVKDKATKDVGTFNQWQLDINTNPNRLQVNKGGYVSIPHNGAYNLGAGAFSVMGYICPNKIVAGKTQLTEGTIFSSKPKAGGGDSNKGGWQLFLEKDGAHLMLCFKTDNGVGYHLLKAPLNNIYDDKAVRNPSGAAADLTRSNVLFKEYTHFVAATRGIKGDMNLYVNGYLIARATPFEPTGNTMATDSFQLKGIFKESIDKPTHFFTVKKNQKAYTVGTANWDVDVFTPIGEGFNMTSVPSSHITTLSTVEQTENGTTSVTSKIENLIPAKNMIAANRVSLLITPKRSTEEKLLAQFSSNVGLSPNVNNNIGLSVGRNQQYADPYEGGVKHVSLWKTALSQEDIITYMDSQNSEGDNTNCIGFWKLEKDCNDSSAIKNNGAKSGNLFFVYKDQILPLYTEEQQRRNWCWAASALSIIELYDPMSETSQTEIVETHHGRVIDNGGWMNEYLSRNTSYLNTSYFLNSRANLGNGTFISRTGVTLDYNFLRKQINDGNPMGVDIQWTPTGGHAVVLSGIEPKTGKLVINDPGAGLVLIDYENFVTGKYPTRGRWNALFTTKGKRV